MENVRRRVGRPSGHVYSADERDRVMARTERLRDMTVTLEIKLAELHNEPVGERFTRNYLLAGCVRQCVFCPEIQAVQIAQNWKAHLRLAVHMDRERVSVICTLILLLVLSVIVI
jgi:hypothetical protein